jgi:iron-sulfur cluster repair protein YtfE (RIC family)
MPRQVGADPPGPRRLADEHAALETQLAELCTRLRAEPRRDLLPAWHAFVDALQLHFAFEEDLLFPAFAQQSIVSSKLVQSLVADHAAARQLAEEIGEQIERQEVRATTLEVFTDLLREHAELENARIYSHPGFILAPPGHDERR